jgi:hypothetical protein
LQYDFHGHQEMKKKPQNLQLSLSFSFLAFWFSCDILLISRILFHFVR